MSEEYDKVKIILLSIVVILLAVIAYLVYVRIKLLQITPPPPTVTPTPVPTPVSTLKEKYPIVQTYQSSGQLTIPLITDKWVVVVSPTQTSNQYFSAYLSMTGKVDDTAVEIAAPTIITSTSVFLLSSNFAQYSGYPYLVINSSAPFTAYIGFAKN